MKNFMAYQVDDEDRAKKKRIFDDNGLRSPSHSGAISHEKCYLCRITRLHRYRSVCQLP